METKGGNLRAMALRGVAYAQSYLQFFLTIKIFKNENNKI